MKLSSQKTLRDLVDWIQDHEASNIYPVLFTEDTIEGWCDNISAKRESKGKLDSDKSQDSPFVRNGDIFKLGVCLEKTYAWIGLKNNTRIVPVTWLIIILDTSPVPDEPHLEGPIFYEYPFSERYRKSAPHNLME